MQTYFLAASIAAIAAAQPYFGQRELEVTYDGEVRTLYIADPRRRTRAFDADAPDPAATGDATMDWNYGGERSNDSCCNSGSGCSGSDTCNWSWPLFTVVDRPWQNDPLRGCRCRDLSPLDDGGFSFGSAGGRMYLSNEQDFDKDKFFKTDLLDGAMLFDVDLSQVAC